MKKSLSEYLTPSLKKDPIAKTLFSSGTPIKRPSFVLTESSKSYTKKLKKLVSNPSENLYKDFDKKEFSEGIEPEPCQVSKKEITHLLEGVIHQEVSKYVLADINDHSLTVVGRSKILGTQRQLCHIIPVAFIKEMIANIVEETNNNHELIRKLSLILTMAANSQSGFAIKLSDLKLLEYSEISLKLPSNANRVLGLEKETVFLLSPSKKKVVFSSPTKMEKATVEFQEYNIFFIKSALVKLAELVEDDNTAIIVSELLTRYIFDLPNASKNTVFAPEGNTARYEIRLYADKENALKCSDNYEVMTARELRSMNHDALGQRIRIVNSEGAKVKNCIDSLKELKNLLTALENYNEIAENYNTKYNKEIKLANYAGNLSIYNNPIICNKSLENQVTAHIAKNLYLAFDLTALEKIVLVPSSKGIEVYISAEGNRIVKHGFKPGKEYRQSKMDETHYSDNHFFRSSEQDMELLPQKLVELFLIGTSSFATYQATHTGFLNLCINQLINIAKNDYCMSIEASEVFSAKVQSIYESMLLSSKMSDEGSSKVVLLGEEFVLCHEMLGFGSDIAELSSYA